jgi:hypothetical protein
MRYFRIVFINKNNFEYFIPNYRFYYNCLKKYENMVNQDDFRFYYINNILKETNKKYIMMWIL